MAAEASGCEGILRSRLEPDGLVEPADMNDFAVPADPTRLERVIDYSIIAPRRRVVPIFIGRGAPFKSNTYRKPPFEKIDTKTV